MHIFYKQLLTI